MLELKGIPNLALDAYQLPHSIEEFCESLNISEGLAEHGKTTFLATKAFFDSIVEAIRALKGRLKLEVICGDLTQELSKMRFSGDESRPADFPKSDYARMWLSNVPWVHFYVNLS